MRDLGSNKREKDVRFEEKRRVVLLKTTYRFIENNVSFVGLCLNGRNDGKKVRREVRKREEKWRRNGGECDTCDSKKSTSLLEGAHARA